jgi:BirA family biotin operon repressor/biotin-[acetyl-CoA-carboxylase] ligase
MPPDSRCRALAYKQVRHIGHRVLWFDELTSTNDYAATLAHDAAHSGVVIVATRQTRGRGQHDKTWHDHPGSSVTLSIIVRPPKYALRPVILTAWSVIAIIDCIEQLTGIMALPKWPNDILIDTKKVSGLLIEQKHWTVIGVGLNVNQTASDLINTGLTEATSLAIAAGRNIPLTDAVECLIQHFDRGYERIIDHQIRTLERLWREKFRYLHGRIVRCELANGTTLIGQLLNIGFDDFHIASDQAQTVALRPEQIQRILMLT